MSTYSNLLKSNHYDDTTKLENKSPHCYFGMFYEKKQLGMFSTNAIIVWFAVFDPDTLYDRCNSMSASRQIIS